MRSVIKARTCIVSFCSVGLAPTVVTYQKSSTSMSLNGLTTWLVIFSSEIKFNSARSERPHVTIEP